MPTFWFNAGKPVVNGSNAMIDCTGCPCCAHCTSPPVSQFTVDVTGVTNGGCVPVTANDCTDFNKTWTVEFTNTFPTGCGWAAGGVLPCFSCFDVNTAYVAFVEILYDNTLGWILYLVVPPCPPNTTGYDVAIYTPDVAFDCASATTWSLSSSDATVCTNPPASLTTTPV